MKRIKKGILCLLIAATLLTAAGCVSTKTPVVTVNEQSISAAMFIYQLRQQKANHLSENSLTETSDLWSTEYDDDTNLGQHLQLLVVENFISTCLWRDRFEKLGLSFTEEEQKEIDDAIGETEDAYGGREAMKKALADHDILYDEYIQSVFYDTQKILKVVDYYYGADGLEPVPEEDVLAYFEDNYVRIKHVLISTSDDSGATLTGSEMKKAKEKAQSVYEKAKDADEAAFDKLIEEYNDDEGAAVYPDGYLFTTGEMTDVFEKAAFDMEVGDTRLVQSEHGFHIMRKLTLKDEDVYTRDVRQRMLLEMKATELQKMLTEWRDEAKIKIDRGVLSKYNCDTVKTETQETSDSSKLDDIAGQLGLTEEDKIK